MSFNRPFILALFILLVVAVATSSPAEKAPAPQNDAASQFRLRCSSCHGQNGDGNTSLGRTLHAADLRSAEVQKQSDEQLAQVIADGRKSMPSFSNSLTQGQVRALVGYIRTRATKRQE